MASKTKESKVSKDSSLVTALGGRPCGSARGGRWGHREAVSKHTRWEQQIRTVIGLALLAWALYRVLRPTVRAVRVGEPAHIASAPGSDRSGAERSDRAASRIDLRRYRSTRSPEPSSSRRRCHFVGRPLLVDLRIEFAQRSVDCVPYARSLP